MKTCGQTGRWNLAVNNEYRNVPPNIIDQSRSGINLQRRAHNCNKIGVLNDLDSVFNHLYRLFKPDNMRTQLSSVIGGLAVKNVVPDIINELGIQRASHFKYLAMKVNYG